MKFISRQIVFREIPDEISLSYLISGCRMRCVGCHSSDSWSLANGRELSAVEFVADIRRFSGRITCVLFMGGEWHEKELVCFLDLARQHGLKTALYTGGETVSEAIGLRLDFLKTGHFDRRLGGLESPATNQRLVELATGRILNFYFFNNGRIHHDQTQQQAIDREAEVFTPLF